MAEDILPTLAQPQGLGLATYVDDILTRFDNSENPSSPCPDRLAQPVATWLRFVWLSLLERRMIADPVAERLTDLAARRNVEPEHGVALVVCAPAETSGLFQRKFNGAVAIGLSFRLPAEDQRQVIDRVARALGPGGRFLFSAPRQICEWAATLTGRPSLSLGETEYQRVLGQAGLRLSGHFVDEGGNDYSTRWRRLLATVLEDKPAMGCVDHGRSSPAPAPFKRVI